MDQYAKWKSIGRPCSVHNLGLPQRTQGGGGGGSLWYLIGTDADLLNSENYAQTTAIADYDDGTNIWEIPNFVIVKLSTIV